jgi:hypothetical protein
MHVQHELPDSQKAMKTLEDCVVKNKANGKPAEFVASTGTAI